MKSLGDCLVDRTESLDSESIKSYFVDTHKEKISRLLDSEQYLLEGSRGIGKTMLMKYAELKAMEGFGNTSVLAVWVSFEESLRLERIRVVDSDTDPFLQWTMGKILYEILSKLIEIKPGCIDALSSRLSSIFASGSTESVNSGVKYLEYFKLLDSYIEMLEKAEIDDNSGLIDKAPSKELVRILDNPTSFKKFLLNIISDFDLARIVLLFDEAAHVFSTIQQEKFFAFFKSLRHPQIACKASVYPGITNYGKTFEKTQDAKELRLAWSALAKDDIDYIKRILKKRLQSYSNEYWNKLTISEEIINIICICSNGNPRLAFHIIDEMQNANLFKGKNINKTQLIASLRKINQSKWLEFSTLSNRMIKYRDYIIAAENLMKTLILPNLRKWNGNRRDNSKKLSAGFYVETLTFERVGSLFDILEYSNFVIVDRSKKSLGHNKYGYYISVNPILLFSDLIINDTNEMNNVSINIDNNQVYTEKTVEFGVLIENLHYEDEYRCSNTKCDFVTSDSSFTFCKACGSKMIVSEIESLYKVLRNHDIENLNLSRKIIERLRPKFSLIGEIYDATLDDLRMKYIQDVRIERIKNAAIEYMAG